MTAAAAYELADSMYHNHSDRCPVCEPFSIDRNNAGCRRGRQLEAQLAGRWRARILALSGRGLR